MGEGGGRERDFHVHVVIEFLFLQFSGLTVIIIGQDEATTVFIYAASVYNSLGFEWVNPVLSLFEDWVLGWVLQTGLLFFS